MSRSAVAALLFLMMVAAVAQGWFFAGSLIDDAYIFFRYADHLLAGDGPVFNPGERVEGFTSPLWLLLLAVAHKAGLGYAAAVTIFGLLASACTLPLVARLACRAAPPAAALLAPLLVALHPGQAMWAVHGLETALFILLLVAGWAAVTVWGRPFLAGLLLGLAFWARPEAVLLVATLAGLRLWRGQWRVASRLLLGAAVAALPLLALRWFYYGSLVPNTFHAKSGGGLQRLRFGLAEARRFGTAHAPLVLACAGSVALFFAARRRRQSPGGMPEVVVEALLLGGLWSGWNIWVGGDGFFGFRFWLPVLPAAGIVLAWGAGHLDRMGAGLSPLQRLARAVGVVLLVAATAAGVWPEARREQISGARFTARMLVVGRWLHDHAPPDATLAVNYVGALPYASGLVTLDMLGLTEPAVARTPISGRFRYPGHAKGNGAVILDRRPDLIMMNGVYLEPRPMVELAPQLASEEEIAADPRFARDYHRVQVRLATPEGTRWLAFFKRRDMEWEPAS